MFRNTFSLGGVLALAGTVALVTAGPAQAAGPPIGGPSPAHAGGYYGGYRSFSGPQHIPSTNPSNYPRAYFRSGYYPLDTPRVWPPASSRSALGHASSYGGYFEELAPQDNTAHVTVKVPAAAKIWVDGHRMLRKGPVRRFESPPLKPGLPYTYEFRARWKEQGRTVTHTRKVEVSAGAHVTVDFPVRPKPQKQSRARKSN